MKSISCSSLAGIALCFAAAAQAESGAGMQSYPNKPIRLIVAYPPGGGADIVARILGQRLGENLGQQVVVDNRGGAAGIIGTETAARALPDGYTLLLGTNATQCIFPSLYPTLPYDPVADFAPVTSVVSVANVLVVHPSVAAKSVKELIALARAKPGQLNYGSAGAGSTTHIAMELFKIMSGVRMEHIPYKGLGPAVADLVGGQLQVMISNMPPVIPHAKSGRLRALAVTGAQRSAATPELPTIAEAALPGYEADVWYGVLAPAGVPKPVVTKLQTEIVRILRAPDMKERLSAMGAEPIGNSPEAFARVIKADIVKWARVVKESGARVE
jgi:tripartite-type tricarboxylate transporter receptor subunit TctC